MKVNQWTNEKRVIRLSMAIIQKGKLGEREKEKRGKKGRERYKTANRSNHSAMGASTLALASLSLSSVFSFLGPFC